MQVVADTNIWLRIADPSAVQHSIAKEALGLLIKSGAEIFLAPQNLVKFWAVATRPRELNGFGWTIENTDNEIQNLLNQFSLLPENDRIFQTWRDSVRSLQISGKRVHDARLAAQLRSTIFRIFSRSMTTTSRNSQDSTFLHRSKPSK